MQLKTINYLLIFCKINSYSNGGLNPGDVILPYSHLTRHWIISKGGKTTKLKKVLDATKNP